MQGKTTRGRLICSVSHLVIVLLLIHVPGQLHPCCAEGADAPSDPYDVLYDVIMTRHGPDGEAYGANESAPAIFSGSEFPFDDRTYSKLDAALDAFAALSQTEIEAYSDIQRALMQRHLWYVFDAAAPYVEEITDRVTGKRRQDFRNKSQMHRRDAMRPKIASLIQSLALPKARILALPDTTAATLESGVFSARYDPGRPFKPFLPPDLFAKETSWVCLGDKYEPPAPFHQRKATFRSAFLSFMRLPGGRGATLEYIKKDTQQRGHVKHFPAGTQFAFIEQAFLISDQGELVLSPLVLSISLRAYLDVERTFSRVRRVPTQSLAEFVAQPRQLVQGNAVMKPLGRHDLRFDAGDVSGLGEAIDPFERRNEPLTRGRGPMLRRPRLDLCMTCHNDRGADGVAGGGGMFGSQESSPEEIVKETMSQKRDDYTWKSLIELWREESGPDDGQANAESGSRPSQTQRSSRNTNALSKPPLPDRRRSAPSGLQIAQASPEAETQAADPYDVLYDVIMTRAGRSSAEDETGPLIFPNSHFPFGDKTYEKLNAALDAFATLPQSKIAAYSDIKRALLQRHLWKVYDASHPIYYTNRVGKPAVFDRNHANRRAAVRPKIASLIHRLALTRAQILALPNTLTATVKSGGFAESHDPDELFKPFLPPDLYTKESSWICQGDAKEPVPADVHSKKFKWRSAFLSFLRAPGGRAETLKCVEKFNRGEALPLGTQSALIEQAFLISDQGELVLSPLIVSISLRAYVGVMPHPRSRRGGLAAKQCVAEFLIQTRPLMQGDAVMRALTPTDHRFEAGDVSGIEGGEQDPFEYAIDAVHPRLRLCLRCHANPGRIGLHTTRPPLLRDVSPEAISEATSTRKRDHQTWKALYNVWRAASVSD